MAKVSRPVKARLIRRRMMRTYQPTECDGRMFMRPIPLVQGGQGRDDKDITFSTLVVFWCLIGLAFICIIAGFMQ